MALTTDRIAAPVLVCGSDDDAGITAWNVDTGELLSTFADVRFGGLNDIAVARSADGRVVAAACGDFGIGRWDVHTGRPLGHGQNFDAGQYRAVALHGGLLAAAPHVGSG